ncbi:MAG: bifunctional adenosylcobinamide kinase/adenosylcobinamide-phosphate guanylyltransferase [Deltaproteobacteria bacterium]|nr:bifunctional adenosylcobinamide kinase/adenosylcobinamide-phosphate guanylyltransferase [Deltaproteobacteria bacterium]
MVLTLITGGCRSGKSAHAIALASTSPASRKFFIATGQPIDDEMRARIEHHRRSRPADFQTIEEPVNLVAALESLGSGVDMVVVDCLTLWISNLLQEYSDDGILTQADELAAITGRARFSAIIVTDEVGWGLVPDHPVARRFRDLLGWTNQRIARAADDVLLMVAGYPLRLK